MNSIRLADILLLWLGRVTVLLLGNIPAATLLDFMLAFASLKVNQRVSVEWNTYC